MSTTSYVSYHRYARVVQSQAEYVLVAQVTGAGDLPDRGFFVFSIVDDTDPNEDAFTRVASVGDLLDLSLDRPTAVAREDGLFRSLALQLSYTRVDAAIAAANSIDEQVNLLVTEYQTYLGTYEIDPAQATAYPQTQNTASVQGLITDYTAAVAASAYQQALIADKQVECARLDAEYTAALQRVTDTGATLDAMNATVTALQTLNTALTSTMNSLDSMRSVMVGTLGEYATQRALIASPTPQGELDAWLLNGSGALYDATYQTLDGARAAGAAALSGAGQQISTLITQRAVVQAQYTTYQADRDAALQAKNTCATEVTVMQAVLAEQQRQEALLLGQIRALCPSYVP